MISGQEWQKITPPCLKENRLAEKKLRENEVRVF